jgi:hypothetical protein
VSKVPIGEIIDTRQRAGNRPFGRTVYVQWNGAAAHRRRWAVAAAMDCSQCPVHPQPRPVFFEFAKKHSDTLRRNGVEPMFLMTWAYQDKPEMTQGLADAYTEAGRLNRAHVIPAGLAFVRSIAKRPELNLYVADKRHPSPAGTYLTAATVVASVYGVSPVGATFTAGLDPAIARHLQ